MIAALALPLAFVAVDAATTVPTAATRFMLTGSLVLVSPREAGMSALPLPALTLTLAHGLGDRADLRLHYDTVLGLAHRLGVEVRATVARSDRWAFGTALTASAMVYMVPYQGLYTGGDVSTHASAMVTGRVGSAAVTLDAGVTAQWMVFTDAGQRLLTDLRPRVSYANLGARVEWARSPGRTYALGIDISVPVDRNDPIAWNGAFPRLTFGGTWSR